MTLQFALDNTDPERSWEVVDQIKDLIDRVELGHLGLHLGLDGIRMVKEKFPNLPLEWDQKCASVFSNNLAIDCKPDFVTINRMTEESARKVVEYGHSKGVKVIGDIGGGYGANGYIYINYVNAGCDEISVMARISQEDPFPLPTKVAAAIRERYGIKFSVWGKLTRDNMIPVLELKPDNVVIGKAIYNAPNPREETMKIKELLAKYS